MVLKIKVAAEARRDPATLIVARTDARTGHGLDEALRRARLYEQAGADVIFVESPESEAELERIGKEVEKPLLANMPTAFPPSRCARVEAHSISTYQSCRSASGSLVPGMCFSTRSMPNLPISSHEVTVSSDAA